MKVYLMGFMGSGKSTVGRLLASEMKLDFIDFDKYLEEESGKTIAELFDTQGEESFRTLEHEHLKKLLHRKNVVISLGGGTPCFHNNMELINNSGISVYLETDVNTLNERLSKGKKNRPLIRDLNNTELKHFITANLEKRMIVYRNAKYTVSGKNNTADKISENIFKLLVK